jgi:copper chaperone CopZ
MPTTIVSIPGIHCAACATLIKDVSSDFPEIQSVDVDVTSKQVTIQHGDDFPKDKWIAAVEELDAKYKVQPVF